MRVLICGDRHWTDEEYMDDVMRSRLEPGDVVIHGNARGADKMAGAIAEEMGLEVEAYPAKWKRYGRAAGPVRNLQMLDEGKPDEVWAFHHDLEQSKGTKNMVGLARSRDIPVEHFAYEGE